MFDKAKGAAAGGAAAARPTLQIVPPPADADAAADGDADGDADDKAAGEPLRRLETPNVAQLEAMLDAADAKVPAAGASGADDAASGAGGGTAMIRGLPKSWDERDFAKWLDMLVAGPVKLFTPRLMVPSTRPNPYHPPRST